MLVYDNGEMVEYYPSEMPDLFLSVIDSKIADELSTKENKELITEALYYLQTISENQYNSKGFKLLYQVLDNIAKEIDYKNLTNKWRN